jgi:hypothetical protein
LPFKCNLHRYIMAKVCAKVCDLCKGSEVGLHMLNPVDL